MSEKLKGKLSRSKHNESERDAFTEKEYQRVLAMLKADRSAKGLTDYALFRLGCTSGLRAAELAGLKWENLTEADGLYRATFTGKGSKVRTVQVEPEAYRAAVAAFRKRYRRKPTGNDYVFNGLATGRAAGRAGMTMATVYSRVKGIADRAKAAA